MNDHFKDKVWGVVVENYYLFAYCATIQKINDYFVVDITRNRDNIIGLFYTSDSFFIDITDAIKDNITTLYIYDSTKNIEV